MTDLNDPVKILQSTRVPEKNIFFLGCFESRVTVLSQQRRALNLVDAILNSNIVRKNGRVAIIGGGAAGVTAAAAFAVMARQLEAIHLYETQDRLLHLQHGSDRNLHPNLYDWPATGATDPNAGLPILNWKAGAADAVATEILREFFEIFRQTRHLEVRTNHCVDKIESAGIYCRLPKYDTGWYDAVIIAIGFGYENEIRGENQSYWAASRLTGPLDASAGQPLFISGNGDGGLVDFIMAAFARMTHSDIIDLFINNPSLGETQKTLLEIEERAWADSDEKLDILEEYEKGLTVPPKVLLDIFDRLRADADIEVWLHTRETRQFRRTSAILNRFAAFLVKKADSYFGRNRIRFFRGCDFTAPPRSGSIDIGYRKFDPLHRFLRFGANKEKNLLPFENLIREYKNDHVSTFREVICQCEHDLVQNELGNRLATPLLNESARRSVVASISKSARIFVSHASADQVWARWIAWQIEETTEYKCVFGAWDFLSENNVVRETQSATRDCVLTIAVLTPNYLSADFRESQWTAAFGINSTRENQNIFVIKVRPCEPRGPLKWVSCISLVDLDETTASERLISCIEERQRIPKQTRLSARSRLTVKPEFPAILSRYWLVSDQHELFTGRKDILEIVREKLSRNRRAALVGMPGVGKTETAIEYAHCHRNDYDAVFFVRAQTEASITAGMIEIASMLGLPSAVANVKDWFLKHDGWLLIADNVGDRELIKNFLPLNGPGDLLLTTGSVSLGWFADSVELKTMDVDDGACVLLQRAGLLAAKAPLAAAPDALRAIAQNLSREMGGLPLALDHAGAFIQQTPCSPEEYLVLYSKEGKNLRSWPGGSQHTSVAVTFSLAFEQVTNANRAAAELLRLCAFLAPDEIPEEILIVGAPELGDNLALVAANDFQRLQTIAHAARFSLLAWNASAKTLTIHRQVQAVLRDGLRREEEVVWVTRAVCAVNRAFPTPERFSTWATCEAMLPHALICGEFIRIFDLEMREAVSLLNKSADYLERRARYAEAESLCRSALKIGERVREADPETAYSLWLLALISLGRDDLTQAEQLCKRALAIRERVLGMEHRDTASCLNILAGINRRRGNFPLAKELCERALQIRERTLGAEHPDTLSSLSNLGGIYYDEQEFDKAVPLFRRAVDSFEIQEETPLPIMAVVINNLAETYYKQGKLAKAEPLYKQGKLAEAEPLFRRAVAIMERTLGTEHPSTAISLSNLAKLCRDQEKLTESEALFLRVIGIAETLARGRVDLATILEEYALLLEKMHRADEAMLAKSRAVAIRA